MPGLDPITSILNLGTQLIDKLVPDKTAAAQAKAQLLQLQVQGDLADLQGQIQTNIAEAQSSNKFAADWRPMFGYVGAFAFGYSYIVQPVFTCLLAVWRPSAVAYLPKLDMSALMPIALGMLGLSATHFADPMGPKSQ